MCAISVIAIAAYKKKKGRKTINGLFNILFFMVILVLGLVYAWKKGALEWK